MCVCLCSAPPLWPVGRTPSACWDRIGPAQEMLRGLLFLFFSLMTLMKGWKESLVGWAKRHQQCKWKVGKLEDNVLTAVGTLTLTLFTLWLTINYLLLELEHWNLPMSLAWYLYSLHGVGCLCFLSDLKGSCSTTFMQTQYWHCTLIQHITYCV